MKQSIYFFFAFIFGIHSVNANVISSSTAQTVAVNFYKHTSQAQSVTASLAYTEISSMGDPVYFVFNMNDTEGFVIVSAEDAGHPIIGYSTEGNYTIPSAFSNPALNYWMQERKNEILAARTQNIQPDLETANEWNSYITNKISVPQVMVSVAPLCSTTWDQNGYYNDLCPGNSVTGCQPVAMGQIMKKWNYPAQGTGSKSYTQSPNPNNYPAQSVNFAAATYDWANMPNVLTASSTSAQKNAVATLLYHLGVSVEIVYSPGGSSSKISNGAFSYKTYFGYDPLTLKTEYSPNNTPSAWVALLKKDLDKGMPIQYNAASTSGLAHGWVCDGYDVSDKFHMNWGWGGVNDGYFSLNGLSAKGYTFPYPHWAIVGIQPKTATAIESINAVEGFSSYPNPFSDVAAIKFQLNTADNVSVKVYDVYGKEVNTVINTQLIPGEHTFYWAGDDNQGNQVAGGVYNYTISTSTQAVSKQMIFINQ